MRIVLVAHRPARALFEEHVEAPACLRACACVPSKEFLACFVDEAGDGAHHASGAVEPRPRRGDPYLNELHVDQLGPCLERHRLAVPRHARGKDMVLVDKPRAARCKDNGGSGEGDHGRIRRFCSCVDRKGACNPSAFDNQLVHRRIVEGVDSQSHEPAQKGVFDVACGPRPGIAGPREFRAVRDELVGYPVFLHEGDAKAIQIFEGLLASFG